MLYFLQQFSDNIIRSNSQHSKFLTLTILAVLVNYPTSW